MMSKTGDRAAAISNHVICIKMKSEAAPTSSLSLPLMF
jgi:hypothetical protein